MDIICTNCGRRERTDKDFFVNLIGGAMPVGGFWAWTSYLFAGTGFAMAIVLAIIGGGVAMLIFKDEIVEWIVSNDYKCQNCGSVEWKAGTEDKDETLSFGIYRETDSSNLGISDDYLNDFSVKLNAIAAKKISNNDELEQPSKREAKKLRFLKNKSGDKTIKRLIADVERKNKPPSLRFVYVEKLLSAFKCEIRKEENDWLVVDSKGNSKKVSSIDELEEFSISYAQKINLSV